MEHTHKILIGIHTYLENRPNYTYLKTATFICLLNSLILLFIYSSYSANLYRMPDIWAPWAKYWRHMKLWTGHMAQEITILCGKGQSKKVRNVSDVVHEVQSPSAMW